MSSQQVQIDFGWGRKPMADQLSNMGFSDESVSHLEKDADAIIRLHIRGLITDGARDGAIKKAVKYLKIPPTPTPLDNGE